jgi:hypothetical protein
MAIKNYKLIKFKQMKKIFVYMAFALLVASCESSDVEFPDYTFQTVYFPVQHPVRTLVLGESRSDNAIDLDHAFTIGANVGGLYDNTQDRIIKIEYAPELVDNLVSGTDTLAVLPENYYSASSLDEIVIPAGSFDGRIRIDLTDEFFNDPATVGLKYVIPLLISPATKDSILTGKPVVENPLRTLDSDWEPGSTPKDYTLFAVKYINRYHGTYLHRGTDELLDATGTVIETKTYSETFIEEDLLTSVTTVSLSESTIDRLGGDNLGGVYQMKLKFNDDKSIVISGVEGGVAVSGTGTFKETDEGEVWGGTSHMTLYLDYTYTDNGGDKHHATETMVYRDNAVIYEEFDVTIVE